VPAVPRACARGYRSVCPSGAGVLKHERFHGFRTARCRAAGASPVATDRRPVGAKNGRYKVCPPLAGSRFPAVGRRLPFWQFPRFSPVAPAFGLPPSACSAVSAVKAVRCCRCHSALRTPHSALVTPVPALLYGHGCPQVSGSPACPPLAGLPAVASAKAGSPFPGLPAIASGFAKATPDESGEGGFPPFFPAARVSPGFRHPVFRSLFPAFGSYAQRRMPMRACKNHQIRVKIDQNGDVFRQKAIKNERISSCPS